MLPVRHDPVRNHAVAAISNSRHPATVIASGICVAVLGTLYGGMAASQSILPKEVDVRSFLGDPLNVRIAVPASLERESGNCQAVIDRDGNNGLLRARDLQLTMVELRAARFILVRSTVAINEPVVSFAIRIGCPGETAVDREITVLLDPPPFSAGPVAQTADAGKKAGTQSGVTTSGNWTVIEGDTLLSIAKGIHPRNRARQKQYLHAMRELNPDLGDIADGAGLKAGTLLRSPDLKTLSGITPGARVKGPAAAITEKKETGSPNAKVDAAAKAPVKNPRSSEKSAKPQTVAPIRSQPSAAPAETAKPSAEKASGRSSAQAAPAVATPKATEPASGFRLRLSGAEIDLSRSRNVTDEQRNALREKQLMLDADDQVAALLSLRNTVKQLESRLNEMQLKLAVTPPASAAIKTEAKPAVAESARPTAADIAPAVTAAVVDEKPAIAPPATPTPIPPAPKFSADPADTTASDSLSQYLPSSLTLSAIAGGLLLLLGAWWWSRRGRSRHEARDENADNPLLAAAPATSMGSVSRSDAEFADWEGQRNDAPPAAPANGPDTGPPMPANERPADIRFAPPAPARAVDVEETPPGYQATVRIDSPVIFDDTPARYELDSSPATTVDFPLGLDDKPPEDRVRRLQYMHERYPELKTNTVSIDDADSVINAARLYYDEGDNRGGGRDKACELLTFAVEERPQEIRFWLAQFEIFRLEGMTAEFGALAAKFQMLFSHTPAWPKVRHIGHEIDPGNPLYAESGRPSLGGETRFDPIAENWLNAPMDFTSDALTSDLRLALLDDHNVTRVDFEQTAAKLTATGTGAG